jgi:3-oxoacyl-[acyl-carrier protein] reductase
MNILDNETILRGQTAIVTGGGTGMGAAIACMLGREGVRVVVCGRRVEPLERVIAAIQDAGGEALAVRADVAVASDVVRLVKATTETYRTVDILVNNAGIGGGGRIHEHDIEAWDRVIAVNLRGPFLMARAVLPLMRAQKHGHIINISSESAHNYYEGNGAYGVAKHALNALSEYIQRENQEHNIRVDVVSPGMVITEMTEDSPGLHQEKALTGDDIAELVLWLVSRRPNIKIGTPILIQTMLNPWK